MANVTGWKKAAIKTSILGCVLIASGCTSSKPDFESAKNNFFSRKFAAENQYFEPVEFRIISENKERESVPTELGAGSWMERAHYAADLVVKVKSPCVSDRGENEAKGFYSIPNCKKSDEVKSENKAELIALNTGDEVVIHDLLIKCERTAKDDLWGCRAGQKSERF